MEELINEGRTQAIRVGLPLFGGLSSAMTGFLVDSIDLISIVRQKRSTNRPTLSAVGEDYGVVCAEVLRHV